LPHFRFIPLPYIMNRLRYILALTFITSFVFSAWAQKNKGGVNLPKFDYKAYHFGFLLSTNSADFTMTRKADFTFNDSLLSIDNMRQPGFNLALLASLNITKNVNIRFIPGLSFQDRALNYRFLEASGRISETPKRIESVYLDFPLLLKLRTNRAGNFAAYALVGAKYSRDMQSQKDVNQNIEEELIVKLKDIDYSIDVGGGFDFFLTYFKFGIELKTGFGLPNVLLPETHKYSAPLNSLRTRTFVLSFTFEG
jgi:hypothetical protein